MDYDFRLPGYGGAALFLRYQLASAAATEAPAPGIAFDVGFLDPSRFVYYLNREAEDGFMARLGQFLFNAADDLYPERNLSDFTDNVMRLVVSARSSTDLRVEVEARLVPDPDGSVDEEDGLIFETSRAVLLAAASSLSAVSPGATLDLGLES